MVPRFNANLVTEGLVMYSKGELNLVGGVGSKKGYNDFSKICGLIN